MNTTQQRMAAIFNEWARRYAESPDEFGAILDADGKPVEDYGQRCAIYFAEIAAAMAGDLPQPEPTIQQAEIIDRIYFHFGRVDNMEDYVDFAHDIAWMTTPNAAISPPRGGD
jgi:hypothetical protein